MSHDIEYYNDEMFTRFFPITKEGENAWRVIAETVGGEGGAVVFNTQLESTLAQLRRAGYSFKKRAKPTRAEIDAMLSDDEILAELKG